MNEAGNTFEGYKKEWHKLLWVLIDHEVRDLSNQGRVSVVEECDKEAKAKISALHDVLVDMINNLDLTGKTVLARQQAHVTAVFCLIVRQEAGNIDLFGKENMKSALKKRLFDELPKDEADIEILKNFVLVYMNIGGEFTENELRDSNTAVRRLFTGEPIFWLNMVVRLRHLSLAEESVCDMMRAYILNKNNADDFIRSARIWRRSWQIHGRSFNNALKMWLKKASEYEQWELAPGIQGLVLSDM